MKKKTLDTLAWVIEMAAYLCLMYAGLRMTCHLVSGILAKMGVG